MCTINSIFINRHWRQLITLAVVGTLSFHAGCSSDQVPSQSDKEIKTTELNVQEPMTDQNIGSATDQKSLSEDDKALFSQLEHDSPEVRTDVVESIEATGTGLDYLREVITTDPSPEVRSAAIYPLKESEDPRAVDILVMALDDEDPEIVEEVIQALWFIEDPRAIPHLQRMLEHPDEDVRDSAEFALAHFN